ncbi:hypothetical protein [Ramlibacter sp.]|uniref:hypothetical protein n=1 Tax=Ramlibacter sp. TaxID=1917967 RepID=UPI003D0EEB5B
MHSAPSVTYPVGRSRFAARLAALVWLAAAAGQVAWARHTEPGGWRQWLALALLVMAGALAAAGWLRSPRGELAFEQGAWRWRAATGARGAGEGAGAGDEGGHVTLALDLQHRMLLRWRGERTRWLWLARESASPRWSALRRAVYSRASPEEAPPRAKPMPANP